MADWVPLGLIVLGLSAGLLSGAFGIGGGVLMAPVLRAVFGLPVLEALATPLVTMLPTAIVATVRHSRAQPLPRRNLLLAAATGVPTAILAAVGTDLLPSRWLMVTLLVLVSGIGVDYASGAWARRRAASPVRVLARPGWAYGSLGVGVGLVSGGLGLGGGVVALPALTAMGLGMRQAVPQSLMLVAWVAMPSAGTHAWLGHVNGTVALWLAVGLVPGSWVGAGWSARLKESQLVRILGILLVLVALGTGLRELS
ncbi:MAG: sulfite exporter TauE/SafE family protein [Candidatus Sericytochromatia bacterium]|nr:sulfite exporter TauE/SafE family protein [Candidatus Tanganyikabacteria bacterium]